MDLHPNNHHHHHLQQQQQATPPLPPPLHKPLPDHDLKRRSLVPLSSFSNGTLKKHRPLYPPPPPPHNHAAYRECMKNHAASLGGHALDGCGEFMPSPDATPADPASLTCAACGCHRNFHRRLLHLAVDHPHRHHPPPHREDREVLDDGAADDDDGDGDEAPDDDDDDDEDAPRGSPLPPAPKAAHQYYSAPHMLMALSAGIPGGPPGPTGSSPAAAAAVAAATTQVAGATNLAALPRKRFRSKFSPVQKERMQELSERLGWRMQRRDEALVEERCREIGVSRGVFKVWMHNNKHNFVSGPSSRRAAGGAAGGGGGGGGEGTSNSGGIIGDEGVIAAGVNGIGERNGPGDERNGGGGLVLNSSSSPSS